LGPGEKLILLCYAYRLVAIVLTSVATVKGANILELGKDVAAATAEFMKAVPPFHLLCRRTPERLAGKACCDGDHEGLPPEKVIFDICTWAV
jgi:hypothetical protein